MAESLSTPEDCIPKYLGVLRSLRDDWSDEIPERILHSTDRPRNFKVRGGWYQGIVVNTDALLSFAPKDAPQLPEIEELMEYFCHSEEFGNKLGRPGARVERSDIEKGDRLINLTLEMFGEVQE